MGTLIRPFSYIFLSLIGIVLLSLFLAESLQAYFRENLLINLLILIVLVTGIGLSFWRLYGLLFEIEWLGKVQRASATTDVETLASDQVQTRLSLLGSFAMVWRRFFASSQVLTPELASSLVDSAQARVDERRELSRYIISALVILGLVGTFWGLLGALVSMRESLSSLDPSVAGGDYLSVLSNALSDPLRDMGTAFSSSLFGLAASLYFGWVELQTARAQNGFVEGFENWLASLVQAGSAPQGLAVAPAQATVFHQGKSEVPVDLEGLQALMRRGQQDTMVLNNNLVGLLDQVSRIADKLTADQAIHEKILASQADLSGLVERLDALGKQGDQSNASLIQAIEAQTKALSEVKPAEAPVAVASAAPVGTFVAEPAPERTPGPKAKPAKPAKKP